jgi:hypothetical protein
MSDMFTRLQQDLDQRRQMTGLTPADLLGLPDVERRVVLLLARRGDLVEAEVAADLGVSESDLRPVLDQLEAKSFVCRRVVGGLGVLRTHFGRSRPTAVDGDIWSRLAGRAQATPRGQA